MLAPCGWLAPKRDKGSTESAKKFNERRTARQVLGCATAPSLLMETLGMGKKHPSLEEPQAEEAHLCCPQVRKQSGSIIRSPLQKSKKKLKGNRMDQKEVHSSQVVDGFKFTESLLTNNYLSESEESTGTSV